MIFRTSYEDAFRYAITSQTYCAAYLSSIRLPINIDTTGCYKLFYFLTGDKLFHIDHQVYQVSPGDLFVIHPGEWHYFSDVTHTDQHERYVFFFHPDFLHNLSTAQTDLGRCFYRDFKGNIPPCHRVHLSETDAAMLTGRLLQISSEVSFGQDLLDQCLLLELLVLVNQRYQSQALSASPVSSRAVRPPEHFSSPKFPPAIPARRRQSAAILEYLEAHLTENISLESLAGQFFLSESYLCRLFKAEVGTTIHKYVTARRITLAKKLLSQGHSVTDACQLSGFRDYNGFLKSFVSSVGLPQKVRSAVSKDSLCPINCRYDTESRKLTPPAL